MEIKVHQQVHHNIFHNINQKHIWRLNFRCSTGNFDSYWLLYKEDSGEFWWIFINISQFIILYHCLNFLHLLVIWFNTVFLSRIVLSLWFVIWFRDLNRIFLLWVPGLNVSEKAESQLIYHVVSFEYDYKLKYWCCIETSKHVDLQNLWFFIFKSTK